MPLAYYITDRHSCPLPVLQQIEIAVAFSMDLIQIREKDLPTRPLMDLAVRAQMLARGTRTKILINDRLDIALSAGLAGVHLGNHSLPPAVLRAHTPQDFLIGVSTHSCEEFERAENEGANFVTLGPIFRTPSKAAYGAPVGLAVLREVCMRATIPVLALGGVDLNNYQSCLSAGAKGIAAIRLFQTSQGDLRGTLGRVQNCVVGP